MFLSRRKLSTCPFPNIQHSTLLLINNQWKNVIVPNVRNEQETARVGVIKDFKCSCKINWIEKKNICKSEVIITLIFQMFGAFS